MDTHDDRSLRQMNANWLYGWRTARAANPRIASFAKAVQADGRVKPTCGPGESALRFG
jgi:hypothetical protein